MKQLTQNDGGEKKKEAELTGLSADRKE